MSKKTGPLSAQYAGGPFAGQLCTDLGANVFTVEAPNSGELRCMWDPRAVSLCGELYSQSLAILTHVVSFPVYFSGFEFDVLQEPPLSGGDGATVPKDWFAEVLHAE